MAKTDIHVKLTDQTGNAFFILGTVKRALVRAGHKELAEKYLKEAQASDYDNLLRVTMEYVEVD